MNASDPKDLPYRPCVGVMVLNRQGKVWIGHRTTQNNTEYSGSHKLWQMPQGGIDDGEDAKTASLRELYEETGMSTVTYVAETGDWLTYDLPEHLIGIGLKGKFRGQKQMWFVYRFEGEESEIRIAPPPDGHKAEFDDWRWEDLQNLPDLVVDFKAKIYRELARQFAEVAKPC
ncbi:MAG: RNA pyrophosphohydrolase [Pseudomonadota bacterium]